MHRWFSGFGLAVALVACAHHPTGKEATQDFAPTSCQRMAACLPGFYDVAFPADQADGSTSQCVQTLVDRASDDTSSCTDADVETCKSDLAAFCPTINDSTALPASCSKCGGG